MDAQGTCGILISGAEEIELETFMKAMRKTFSVAGVTVRLFFRGGAGWGLLFLVSALAGFMFFATNANDILLDELRLRLKYSLYSFSVLLNVALIYFACVSLRKDIDERRFHNVTSAPVSRGTVWMGKFLGTLAIGAIAYAAASLTLAACCAGFISNWRSASDVETLRENFFLTYYLNKPDLAAFEREVSKEYGEKRRQLEDRQREDKLKEAAAVAETGGHHHDHGDLEGDTWRARKYLLFEIRRYRQMINPGKTGEWFFDWEPGALRGEHAVLKFKFYSNQRRNKVAGYWTLSGGGKTWRAPFAGYPFVVNELKIPVEKIPKAQRLKLVFHNESDSYLFFPVYHEGIQLLSGHRGIFSNYLSLFAFSLAHMATLVALALAFSSLFSYSVAVFASVMMYVTAAFSGIFANVLRDLSFHDQTLWTEASRRIIEFGLWLTGGAEPFPVNGWFSDGLAIPVASLLSSEGLGYALYLAIVVAVGIWALRVKEIDKIPQA